MSIYPKQARCLNVVFPWEYWKGKPWTITCGYCLHSWRRRLPIAEHLDADCPKCQTRNRWRVAIG